MIQFLIDEWPDIWPGLVIGIGVVGAVVGTIAFGALFLDAAVAS